jgi:hypothetical protein
MGELLLPWAIAARWDIEPETYGFLALTTAQFAKR